jgi:alpha-tubulin suppressor-like RCC1 family protein
MALGQTITGFTDQGSDLGTKYVTKEYISTFYPNLVPGMKQPTLYAWGLNNNGQLGDGTTIGKSSPVTVLGTGAVWVQVTARSNASYTIAGIKSDGTLWTWGQNATYGGLGDGTTINRSSPVTTAGGGTTWKQVVTFIYGTAAIKTDGTLWTCGYNLNGQIGDGTAINRSSPVTTAGGGTTWSQISGSNSLAAIKTDGTLWTWGLNVYGNLGDGTSNNRSSPFTVAGGGTTWSQVSVGYNSSAAIKTDGTLWTWGQNDFGSLGDGTTSNRASPATTAGGGTNWRQISGGQTPAAIKTDGTLWTWGYNVWGQIGDGTLTNRSSPVTTIGGGTNWRQVDTSYTFSAAVKTNGTFWVWGLNNSGQLGDGTTISRLSPVTTVAGGTNWKSVAAGYSGPLAISEAQGY